MQLTGHGGARCCKRACVRAEYAAARTAWGGRRARDDLTCPQRVDLVPGGLRQSLCRQDMRCLDGRWRRMPSKGECKADLWAVVGVPAHAALYHPRDAQAVQRCWPTCTVGQRATQRLWYSTTRATCVCCDITCRASPRVEKGRLCSGAGCKRSLIPLFALWMQGTAQRMHSP